MRCEHPACTRNHDLRKRDGLCPRTRADELRRHQEWAIRNPVKYMLSHVRDDASRRGGNRETAESD